ncbi:hypothetical protein K523DRAFT_75858 [Schizophyllum commune Tattone D]|nr:hypothetical protein K523DRAFT_75858 [Schizophyllum commune Tattone D]
MMGGEGKPGSGRQSYVLPRGRRRVSWIPARLGGACPNACSRAPSYFGRASLSEPPARIRFRKPHAAHSLRVPGP